VGRGVRVVLLVATLVAGCGSSAGSVSKEGQCNQMMRAYCGRASHTCQFFGTDQMDECITAGVTSCCSGNCSQTAIATQDDVNNCIADINAATCGNLDITHGGALPASCQLLVRQQPAP
jgi:hypothetical protein